MKNNQRIARKITTTLFAAQSLSSAAFIAGGTVSAIVGAQLSGVPALAGLPSAVQRLGAAFAALVVGAFMGRVGRRWGMTLGIACGAVGAGLAVRAIMMRSFPLFLGGLALFGIAHATMQLGRFAAAEVHPPESRGRAISHVVVGGTAGAILGPQLVGLSGQWASRAGMDELAGPFLAAMVIIAAAALAIFTWLRPDPRDLGREVARDYPETRVHQGATRSIYQILKTPGTFVAVAAMVLGQVVMVLIMGMTSLHMVNYDHTLGNISMVISAHTFGMFAFSIISGRLTDRWGRGPVILIGSGTLILASFFAPLSPGVYPLGMALFLVGLGWNFCYVGGSALLSDQLSPAERSRTQGVNDLFIGLATAAVSFGSGLLFASIGYTGIGIVGAVISLLLLGLIGWWMIQQRQITAIRTGAPGLEN
jgi:MFS family permease